jgi:hypothetical protein
VALDAFDLLVFSYEPELRIAVMFKLQVLAFPAGRGMTGLALFLAEDIIVGVLVAIQAGIMTQTNIVSGGVVAVVARSPFMTFFALGILMLSFQPKGGHVVIELIFIEGYDAACVARMFFMAVDALVFVLAMMP